MDVKKEKYCIVCFKVAENGYEIIDTSTGIMLQFLTIEMNWNSSEELFLCGECAEIANKSYGFKQTSFDTIKRYWVKMDRLETTHGITGSIVTQTDGLKEYSVCKFCMSQVKTDEILSIDALLSDPNIMELYPRCMADIEVYDVKSNVTCVSCKGKFEVYFNFIRGYLNVREKIDKCFKNESFNGNMNQEKLIKIHNFLFANTIKLPHESTEINEIKQEIHKDYKQFEVSCKWLKHEEIDIKDETDIVSMDEDDVLSQENVFEPIVNTLQTQTNTLNHISSIPETMLSTNKDIYQHGTYTCEPTSRIELYKQTLIHKDPSERKTGAIHIEYAPTKTNMLTHTTNPEAQHYKCERYTNETKNKAILSHKNISEVEMYKCKSCTYKTKRKGDLKNHILTHKDISEVNMFKCESCTYEAKVKNYLRRHMLTHKDMSDVKMYKCKMCTYETKRKYALKCHILTHKSISEVEMWKCERCTFETKHKRTLKRHMLTHKDISDVEMFKCKSCTYETKYKNSLTNHILTHKNISEVETYKCASCTFETKRKNALKCHFLTHEDISQLESYRCESCTFETKRKSTLKRHILIHKNTSEVKTYQCESCRHETNNKCNLKRHILSHKDFAEVESYKCESCTFETKRKDVIKRHILIHRSKTEVKMYKCESCEFETKHMNCLPSHILTHKKIPEVNMYECEICTFKTKNKRLLKAHNLTHKSN